MLVLLALACTSPGEGWSSDGDLVEVSAAPLDEMVAVAQVRWTTDQPSVGRVRWTLDGEERWSAPERRATTDHELRVVGIPEQTTVELEAWGETLEGVTSYTAEAAPAELPAVTVWGETRGWVLTSTVTESTSKVLIFDDEGRVVWWFDTLEGHRVFNVELAEDGMVWISTNPGDYVHTQGAVHQLSLDGRTNAVWLMDGVHGAATPLEDGAFAYLAKRSRPMDGGELLYDVIEEHLADGSTRVAFDTSLHFEPERLCNHYDIVIPSSPDSVYYDWTHANSLILSEDKASYYLILRHYDALLKVDRASGEIVWTLGGPMSDFSFERSVDAPSHPHTSLVQDGRVVMMDNGNHHDPPSSRVIDYAIDEDRRTVSVSREIPEENGELISFLGDAKDTPDGGMLITWSTLGRIDLVDRLDEVQWRLETALGYGTGRSTLLSSLDPAVIAED